MNAQRLCDDLMLAIATNSLDIVTEILSDPTLDVNLPDSRGHSPLVIACAYGRLEISRALVNRKADVSFQVPTTRTTPLQLAASNGFVDLVEFLISQGADRGSRDHSGSTAAEYAEMQPQAQMDTGIASERSEIADERLSEMRRSCFTLLNPHI